MTARVPRYVRLMIAQKLDTLSEELHVCHGVTEEGMAYLRLILIAAAAEERALSRL